MEQDGQREEVIKLGVGPKIITSVIRPTAKYSCKCCTSPPHKMSLYLIMEKVMLTMMVRAPLNTNKQTNKHDDDAPSRGLSQEAKKVDISGLVVNCMTPSHPLPSHV